MIPRYSIKEELDWETGYPVYRALRDQDKLPVIIKTHPFGKPDSVIIQRFIREYELMKDKDIEGVMRVYDLVNNENLVALILEDSDCMPLRNWLNSKAIEIGPFLKIAILLSEVLTVLNQADLIHRDIRPANILINFPAGKLKLTGFGMAARHLQGDEKPCLRDFSTQSLAYISPEQTGRMNRGVDYRTDFYSLGAVFYEMLTGQPPFVSDDPLELIHCHIAKTPMPPHKEHSRIPEMLSSIVMKLLAKTAEERYQSARGIRADLENCYRQWQQTGQIGLFPISQQDVSERFEIPLKLYGRKKEIEILLEAFERIHHTLNGRAEMLLVSGYSGIGKTSLINEVQKPVARQKGYFISGKFDQYKRDIPYSAIIQAFQELVRQLLAESESQISTWKNKLLNTLGANGQVIIEVIPEIERIIGVQPPVPELPPAEAQNRFNLVFERFIQVFTQKDHPMTIFLDDLQWADAATLNLLRNLMAHPQIRYLLMIGAYRDNEVSEAHPLKLALTEIKKTGANINNITLKPLNLEHLNEFIADTVKRDVSESITLAQLIMKKTGGNPFFTTQFLKSLHKDELIFFSAEEKQWDSGSASPGWSWNIADIEARDYTDNVVELMADKIRKLDQQTRQVTILAACIGNRFDLHTLTVVTEKNHFDTANDLQPAIREGLIVLISSDPSTDPKPTVGPGQNEIFEFLHDRIQQAAYALIPEDQKQAVHLKVGRLMLRNSTQEEREENLFSIVNHLNIGSGLIKAPVERMQLAELNLEAGKKAKTSTAFQQALNYFREGVNYLPDDCWQAHYPLSFQLYFELAESKYLCGYFEDAEHDFEMLLGKAQSNLERAEIYRLRIIQYENMSRFPEAVEWGKTGLRLLGINLPAGEGEIRREIAVEHQEIKQKLGSRGIAELVRLPVMSDPEKKMSMKLLMTMWAPTYISGYGQLTVLISARMTNLSLDFGNCEESAYGYITHAIAVGSRQGDFAASYEYGRLALEINRTFDDLTARAKVNHMFSCYISFWRKHINTCFSYSKEAYHAGLESGDFIYAAYGAFHESWHALYRGQPLAEYDATYRPFVNFLVRSQYQSFLDAHLLMLNWGLSFRGLTNARMSLTNEDFDETNYISTYRQVPFFAAFYYIAKAYLQYFFGEYETALTTAFKAEKVVDGVRGMIWESILGFLYPLILAARYPQANPKTKEKYWKKLQAFQAQMQTWAENCPENFEHQYLLISAEIGKIHGDISQAIENYENAIRSAQNNGFIQNTALIQERYTQFWVERGNTLVAELYLREALASYQRWGATAKVADMRERYRDLLRLSAHSEESLGKTLAVSAEDTFDFASAIKASQTISGEIELPRLLKKLIQIMIENAGAETGVLVLVKSGRFYIEALGSAEGDAKVLQSQPLEESPDVPVGMINYVKNTLENLLLNNAAEDRRFASDPYLSRHQPKSTLCLPVLSHGELTGILYLENNQAVDAFTDKHAAVLRMLASQAAISLENARLYADMKQEISERKKAEAALQQAHDQLEMRVEERTADLQESEKAYRDLYEEAPNVYFSTNIDGLIKRANRRAVEFFGYSLNAIIGKPILELVADGPTGKDRAKVVFKRFLEDTQTLGEEIQFCRSDGSLVWGSVSVRPIRNAKGEIEATRSIIVDIDKRKQAEEAAKAASRAKSEFLASMSHELRTPLNGILGYAQVLKKDKNLTENQQKGLEIIEKSGEHLLTLINDILDLSKIEAGKLEIQLQEFSLSEFLMNIVEMTRVRALQKGLEFKYRPLSPLPAVVLGDEKRLRQVLLNLLGNAVKFTDPATPATLYPKKGKSKGHSTKGSITFTVGYIEYFSPLQRGPGTFTAVSGDQKNRGNPHFCIQVEDTGSGIEAERLEEIFLPFHQIPQKHKPVEGTGLGLAISQKLVKLMGGELQMTSKPGKGSIFRVVLELPAPFKERDTAVLREKTKKSSGEIKGYAGDPRKILIVDDKWENRSVVINLLSPLGFLLEEAGNGKEAIKKALVFQPHLILMDLVMPEMDGFEAVRNIRKSVELKDVVIIALSASVFEHNRRQSARAGCDDFIPKPLSAELLLSKLQYYLNLEWIWLKEREEASADVPPDRSRDPLVGPPSARAKGLYELAMMGDIHDLEREISLLEKENSELAPFVDRIRELLMNYKMKQVREFVKQFVE